MLRSLKTLEGFKIDAPDGTVGSCVDFLFDDHHWIVRYVVVDTGNWLPGRKVLLSTAKIEWAAWAERVLHVALTKKQVQESPPLAYDQPVSRAVEEGLARHYNWRIPWMPHTVSSKRAAAAEAEVVRKREAAQDPAVRSANEVAGYGIEATDGPIGRAMDLVVDDQGWGVRYLIVLAPQRLLTSCKVLIAPEWICAVSWAKRTIGVDLTQDAVKNAPSYDPGTPLSREYETALYDYYRRPKYWEKLITAN